MARQTLPNQALQSLPKKWALAIIAALILYTLLQPIANSRLGWRLPSLASLMGNETVEPPAKHASPAKPSSTADETQSTEATDPIETSVEVASAVDSPDHSQVALGPKDKKFTSETKPKSTATSVSPKESQSDQRGALPKPNSGSSTINSTQSGEKSKANATQPTSTNDPNLKYGFLKDIGRETYVSPAGLQFTRGSEEGHRLKHLERHLSDIPDRPGKHGVFDGDMPQALRWIDDAYSRGLRGAKGVTKKSEDGRTIYEVPFTKPIGYIGGRDGKRANNPDAKRLRLVVEGNKFITGFPF